MAATTILNRSADVRAILEAVVRPEGRLRIGTALSDLGRAAGLVNGDVEAAGFAVASRVIDPCGSEGRE